jgi:trigger factor
LKVDHDEVHTLEVDVDFTIEEINTTELAELNQELFDKLFEKAVASIDELKAKIKEDAEAQFATQADQKLLGDVTEFLIESTKSIYLQNFLKMVTNCRREKLSPEEAETEYVRSEKGLRFQLIEGRAMAQSDIKITFEDLKAFTTKNIRTQMAHRTNKSY